MPISATAHESRLRAPGEHVPVVEGEGQDELFASLYSTDNWIAVVGVLRSKLGLSSAEIGRGANVSQATVARWLESDEDAPVKASGRLDDLRYVVLWLIRCGMSARLMRFWLAAKNIELGSDPLTAIAAGRFEEVIEAARAFGAGRSVA